jgi:antitoxin component YwqK of YwqJK toxin-antitoxin module
MRSIEFTQRHADGSIWARGRLLGGKMDGYWEWFRKDGTRLRSGYFDRGCRIGTWKTYDRQGRIFRETLLPSDPCIRLPA